VVITDAVFTKLPAQIDFFVVYDGGKIEQSYVQVFDQASGRQNFLHIRFMTSARLWCSMRFSPASRKGLKCSFEFVITDK